MMIEEYFCSRDFTNTLKKANFFIEPLDDESRINVINYFIDISLKYYMLFSEKDKISFSKLNTFLETIIVNLPNIQINTYAIEYNYYLNKYVTDIYAKTLIDKLNIPKNYILNKELTEKIYEYIIDKILGTSYIFHSFNSVFLESIKKYGINPNIMLTPQNELDAIHNIFLSHGSEGILGYQKENCEGQISYSEVPSSVYKYGISSPEWFRYFTNAFFVDNSKSYKGDVLITKDYTKAKNNLNIVMDDLHFTNKEKEKVLSFLYQKWQIYANNNSLTAVIKEKRDSDELIPFKYFILEERKDIFSIQDVIDACFFALNNDCQTKKIIDTSNATYIKLPSYNELIEKILQEKKENTKILKKSRKELLCK